MKSWIYRLKRPQIVHEAEKRNIDTTGTVNDIRRRLSRHLDEHPEMPGRNPTPNPEGPSPLPALLVPPPSPLPPPPPTSPIPDERMPHGKAMNQIRKWGCHFDGRDPLSFLERLTELQRQYRFPDELMLEGLPELLRGKALLWYRNFRDDWRTLEDFIRAFRRQYLPRRYQARLVREIQDRRQRPEEPFTDYASDILTMMRRAGSTDADAKLDRIYENMRAEYKYTIRLEDLVDLADLTDRATEFEEIKKEEAKERQSSRKNVNATKTADAYDRASTCWRCKQRGHDRFNCRRPAKIFCSQCGKDGVRTQECHPHPGNAPAAGAAVPAPRPTADSA